MTEELLAKLQHLIDRQEINDCIHRYTRGLDRHDDELLRSVFHPDAIDNHGAWVGGREEFVQWANHVCHNALGGHMHHITSHTCEIDGDVAHTESYVIFVHRYKDGRTVNLNDYRGLDVLVSFYCGCGYCIDVASQFEKLQKKERAQVLAFLQSLAAP